MRIGIDEVVEVGVDPEDVDVELEVGVEPEEDAVPELLVEDDVEVVVTVLVTSKASTQTQEPLELLLCFPFTLIVSV